MRLRQIALAARELAATVAALRDVLGLGAGHHDPGVEVFGLCNEVIPVGDTFLEVVSPIRADTAAGRYLERRGGDSGYMVLLQTDDAERARKRAAELGVRVVWKADLPEISGTHLHPRDVGGAILSIDEARPPDSWLWAGPGWREAIRSDVSREIVGAELEGEDPAAMAARWADLLERPARETGAGRHEIALDGGSLRFVPARAGRLPGLSAFCVRTAECDAVLAAARRRGALTREGAVRVCGTRIDLAD